VLRAGAILLTIWTGVNLVLALGILCSLVVLHKNAPALLILYGDTQAIGIEPRALATINGLAVMFNACAAAVCGLSLSVIWIPLLRKEIWALRALSTCLLFLQAAGFASDTFFQQKDLKANMVSSLLLLAGLFCAAVGVQKEQ
jgi:hypothetical protein